jgi:methylmalonyl-CoA/ethylmalonyl-CoA epimerase
MIELVDHIGIAVESIEEAAPLYRDVLGLTFEGEEVVEAQGVKVAFFRAGETLIELLEPINDTGPVAKFLERNGPGLHHLALRCPDIEAGRDRCEAAGLRLLSDRPLDGAHGKLISFLHPKDTGRALIELTQRVDKSAGE